MESDFLVYLIALVVGVLIAVFIKKKYHNFSTMEVIGLIILYAVLVLLFTSPVMNLVKKLIE